MEEIRMKKSKITCTNCNRPHSYKTKPNGLSWFALGFSISALIASLIK